MKNFQNRIRLNEIYPSKSSTELLLENDERLSQMLSFHSSLPLYFKDVAVSIRKRSGITIETKMNTFQLWSFHINYSNASTASIIDALTAFTRNEVARTLKNETGIPDYIIIFNKNNSDTVYGPPLGLSKTLSEKSDSFFKHIYSQNQTTRDAILNGQNIKFSSLPENVKSSLRDTMQSLEDSTNSGPADSKIDFRNMDKALITVKNNSRPRAKFLNLFVTMKTSHGSYGFTINDYFSQKAKFGNPASMFEIDPNEKIIKYKYTVDCGEDDLFIKYADAKKIKQLNRKISTNFKNSSISEILRQLYNNKINIISSLDYSESLLTFKTNNLTIWETLDLICKHLGRWQWEFRKNGFIILREANHGRKRLKGLNDEV
ncbi:hypothetical protein [Armatimonas sp.]|uniref:hypothetical protein n=1 Tax=Armatimonas sp. TaxID=1872638 RepID=UPI00286BCE74|nr:hypothetical protein [Armatimonas sp.]